MTVVFSDLDNTLIYSKHREIASKKIVVECIQGSEQSYMTEYTYHYLRSASWLSIVPVTTRTVEQFCRLTCINDLDIERALVCNGGSLLEKEKENDEWSIETLNISKNYIDKLDEVYDYLSGQYSNTSIHRPKPYMVYFKSKKPRRECEKLLSIVDNSSIKVDHDRRKVYLLARGIDKGNAIIRYKSRIKTNIDVAIGDGVMDVPMLNQAKYAFAAKKIAPMIYNNNLFVFDGECISDKICDTLQRLHDIGEI